MRIDGVRRLLRQIGDLPEEVHTKLVATVQKTVTLGVAKAKAVSPVDTGKFRGDINGQVVVKPDQVVGFINLYDGDVKDGLAASSINYGWGDMPRGFFVREQTKAAIAGRHKRAVKRVLKAAIKDAMNG